MTYDNLIALAFGNIKKEKKRNPDFVMLLHSHNHQITKDDIICA